MWLRSLAFPLWLAEVRLARLAHLVYIGDE
jgi:hypothetical protein